MKNYCYDLQNFRRALRRNNVQKVFLRVDEFWFYTRKGVISHKAEDVEKLRVWLVSTLGVKVYEKTR